MIIRPATVSDIDEAARIYDMAKAFMREVGNPDQWPGDYPNGYDIALGIEEGVSYVCEDGGEIIATFLFKTNAIDPTYRKIYDGQWLNDEPYSVIHRIAVKYHGRGIVDFCFSECYRLCPNLKIDTHRDNIPMQRVLARAGFEYCGIIHLDDGSERLAYQKCE